MTPEEEQDASGSATESADAEERGGLQEQLDETKKQLLYLQAELENVRKASERDRLEFAQYAAAAVLERLLVPLDELDAAAESLPEEHASGVTMVRDNIRKALAEFGLREIPANGVAFDPYTHEAVEVVTESELDNGTIAKVLRKGYTYNKRVLRPALVAVVKRGDRNGKDNRD